MESRGEGEEGKRLLFIPKSEYLLWCAQIGKSGKEVLVDRILEG